MPDIQDKEVMAIQKEAGDIISRAQNYLITSNSSYEDAGNIVSWIAQSLKKIEERRKFFTQPLNHQIKNINQLFKGYSEPFVQADKIVRAKMITYRQEQEQKRLEEEKKMKKEAEKIAKKEGIDVSEVMASQDAQEAPSATDKTSIRKIWTFEILDIAKIPRQFLMPDETSIRNAIRSGVRKIAGVKIFEKDIVTIK